MEYIEIKNNIIIGHYCGDMPKQKDPTIEYRIIENCAANIGDDIRIYDDIQSSALHHVKSNRKKSGASCKNLTQNRSPKEGRNGVRYANEKEMNRRDGEALLYGRKEAKDKNPQ